MNKLDFHKGIWQRAQSTGPVLWDHESAALLMRAGHHRDGLSWERAETRAPRCSQRLQWAQNQAARLKTAPAKTTANVSLDMLFFLGNAKILAAAEVGAGTWEDHLRTEARSSSRQSGQGQQCPGAASQHSPGGPKLQQGAVPRGCLTQHRGIKAPGSSPLPLL